MNSKDKAEELIEKFNILHPFQNLAKKCALIAVDEVLEHCYEVMKPFWQEVKQEIELL
jgi:fido (protein-threonine AMPylation protein)